VIGAGSVDMTVCGRVPRSVPQDERGGLSPHFRKGSAGHAGGEQRTTGTGGWPSCGKPGRGQFWPRMVIR